MKNLSIKTQSDLSASSPWLRVHPQLGISLMDHLYNQFHAMYPIRWQNAYPNEATVRNWRETWSKAFDAKGITPDQIKIGISECLELYDWPPSLKEFIAACRTVKPAAHRNFPPALTHKSSPEVNQAGLQRLKEELAKAFAKKIASA